MASCLWTINGGSSSIKFAFFMPGDPPQRRLSGMLERLGSADAVLSFKESVQGGAAGEAVKTKIDATVREQAVGQLLDRSVERLGHDSLVAIGHRIVHGGPKYSESQSVTPEMIAELKRLQPLDPEHLPQEIGLLAALAKRFPKVPQVACFDTAFHHDLPAVARRLPIPRRYDAQGVRRYGFHGLSYAYLMQELARVAGPAAASGRIILAHLGAGASMAAVHERRPIDTSMAFTPTAGLVMGTRSGDLDPGLLIHLLRNESMSADELDRLVNKESGMLGISETSADMRDLIARESDDPRAAEAVAMFCYQAKKFIGAYVAALSGLDTLVFSGGIGENAPLVRQRICEGLGCLGIELDAARNAAGNGLISATESRVAVRVIRTDEEGMIARETQRIVGC